MKAPSKLTRLFWLAALTGAGVALLSGGGGASDKILPRPNSLRELLALTPNLVARVPITRMNLLCAEELSAENCLSIEQSETIVSAWALRVKSETERHFYRFRQDPAQFENSEGFFRMLMLSVVLAEDFKVHYDEDRKLAPGQVHENDGFFADPQSVFLSGLLGPQRKGTCSSLPVLYVAIGRELGYPLKLVPTKGHLFVRWEGAGERFNIEATSHGISRFNDDHYRHWPFEITPAEEASEGYLKSLAPAGELAAFLSVRGMCLREQGRLGAAAEAFGQASRLAPECASYRKLHNELEAIAIAATRPTDAKIQPQRNERTEL